MANPRIEEGANHAWRYFEFHAAQRITVFNFYVAAAGLLITGIAIVLLGNPHDSYLGVAAGILLTLLSFLFWKFDQRISGMIKRSEVALEKYEEGKLEEGLRVFCADRSVVESLSRSYLRIGVVWTYGMAFRLIFFLIGFTGAVAAIIAAVRYFGC